MASYDISVPDEDKVTAAVMLTRSFIGVPFQDVVSATVGLRPRTDRLPDRGEAGGEPCLPESIRIRS